MFGLLIKTSSSTCELEEFAEPILEQDKGCVIDLAD